MAACIITGCALHILAEDKSLWGDLFVQDNTYIFNGVTDDEGKARWEHGVEVVNDRALVVSPVGRYFEKRGVVVIPSRYAELNHTAKTYLQQGA